MKNTNIQTALAVVREAGRLPVTWNTIDECTAEILQWKNTIGLGAYRIGQALLWAKAKLPHGEFGNWLRDSVDFSVSSAQNFMRIAREVDEGSTLAALPYTKVLALLELPAAEREQFAEEHHVEDKTAAEIKRLIREKEEAEKKAEQVALELADARKRAERAESSNGLQVEKLQRQRVELEEARRQAKAIYDANHQTISAYREENENLKRKIADLKSQPPTIVHEVPEDYQELKAAVEKLAVEKQAAEAEADRLADEVDRLKTDSAREESDSPAARILSAIGGMIAMTGRDPARLTSDPDTMSEDDWQIVMDKVNVLQNWCQAMEAAWLHREESRR